VTPTDRAAPQVREPRREEFRFVQEVSVRFRDLDPMGHVHHSLPLMYWEEARAGYWRTVAGRETVESIDYVMGGFTLHYHQRILYPGTLLAGVRTTRVGRSSFDMAYGLWADDGRLLSSGTSTQVLFDYDAGRSRPMDEATRRSINEFESG
jgi:acyl-CoA thioester hydrolase